METTDLLAIPEEKMQKEKMIVVRKQTKHRVTDGLQDLEINIINIFQ